MATPRTARVADVRLASATARVLALVCAEPLGFIGGQYIIIDSGRVLPSGKAAKRAYSILSSDADQRRFEIAVKRIPDGPVSGYLHDAEPGAEIVFSGPWGKLVPPDDATGATVIVATDTGITAALGLVQAERFAALRSTTTLIWLSSGDEFLPDAEVRARIPAGLGDLELGALPAIGHPERVPHARAVLARTLARRPAARVLCTGDGQINYALLDDFVAAGIPGTRDSVESFFHMPKKSGPS